MEESAHHLLAYPPLHGQWTAPGKYVNINFVNINFCKLCYLYILLHIYFRIKNFLLINFVMYELCYVKGIVITVPLIPQTPGGFCINRFGIGPIHYVSSCSDLASNLRRYS